MTSPTARPLAPAVRRTAALAGAALVLAACSDATAPQREPSKTTPVGAPAGPSLARVGLPSGTTGGVATPYPSVACDGGTPGRRILVAGATVSPATGIISSTQYVVGDVFLKRYTSTGWVIVNALRTYSGTMSGSVQIAGLTNRATLQSALFRSDSYGRALPAGYYTVETRLAWMNDAYNNGFYSRTGLRLVTYSDAADYKPTGVYGRITAGTGWCYIY